MNSWAAAYGAAMELSQKTGIRHKVYKEYFPINGWFISRLESTDDAYRKALARVSENWRFKEKYRLVQHEQIGYASERSWWRTSS